MAGRRGVYTLPVERLNWEGRRNKADNPYASRFKSCPRRLKEEVMSQAERTRKHTNDYRDCIANASPEQKALWARERKLQDKHEHREEYMKIVNSLLVFLPPSSNNHGGKYGLEKRQRAGGVLEGVKIHLIKRNF